MNLGLWRYGSLVLFFVLGRLWGPPRWPWRYWRLSLFLFFLLLLLLFLLFRRYVLQSFLKEWCGLEDIFDFWLIDHGLKMAEEVGELRTQRGIDRDCGSPLDVSRDDHVCKGDPLPDEEGARRKVAVKRPQRTKLGCSKSSVNLNEHSIKNEWMAEKLSITGLLYGDILPSSKNRMISVVIATSDSTRWIHWSTTAASSRLCPRRPELGLSPATIEIKI